ncbi:MAG: hypothetical protein H0V33_04940 [Acidimicrobiia bacterium]|jgi:hypothetical protein|nr:hypothetical protein [Acidimicrobiia bacterium]
MDPTDVDVARADAVAGAVRAGTSVLLVGSPLPGVGDALTARGCTVTVLAPPTRLLVEPWASSIGTVDEIRPDPGPLDSFGAIVAPHLLDLAADPATSLRRIAQALDASGRIVLTANWPAPAGALHRHDATQVERLCELAGLSVLTATPVAEGRSVALVDGVAVSHCAGGGAAPLAAAGASITVVVAHRPTSTPPSEVFPDEPIRATVTTAVDRRLRDQQARIAALEDEVRALRAALDRPPRVITALVRTLRTKTSGHG